MIWSPNCNNMSNGAPPALMLQSGASRVRPGPAWKHRSEPKTSRQGPGWRNPRGSQPGPDFARNSYPPGQPLKEETGTSAYRSVAGSTDLARTGPGQALVGETRVEANQVPEFAGTCTIPQGPPYAWDGNRPKWTGRRDAGADHGITAAAGGALLAGRSPGSS